MKTLFFFLCILPCFAQLSDKSPSSVQSIPLKLDQCSTPPSESASTRLIWENDICFHNDSNYTNGAQIQYLSSAQPISSNSILTALTGMKHQANLRQQWGLSLTQYIFTPEKMAPYPLRDQRPFAGFLGLGYANIIKSETRNSTLELQLGVTGDPSGAEGAQNYVHEIFRLKKWDWNYNLPTEVTFQIYYKRHYRFQCLESSSFLGMETDGFGFWHADIGTVYLRAGLGAQVRFGYNLPATIASPGIAGGSYASHMFVKERTYKSLWSIYGVAALGGTVVGRDMFLDGPAFHTHPSYVGSAPLVGQASMGVVIARKSLELGVFAIYRSPEYRSQSAGQWITSAELRWNY